MAAHRNPRNARRTLAVPAARRWCAATISSSGVESKQGGSRSRGDAAGASVGGHSTGERIALVSSDCRSASLWENFYVGEEERTLTSASGLFL